MSSERSGNDSSSATTSTSERKKPSELSEADFLAQQAEDAKAAISQTLHDMADSLKEASDVRAWTEQHPWAAMGVAAVAGFLAASVITPAKDETFGERFKSLMPEDEEAEEAEESGEDPPPRQRKKKARKGGKSSGMFWKLAAPALAAAKAAAFSAAQNAVKSRMDEGKYPGPDAVVGAHEDDPDQQQTTRTD